MGRRNSSLIVCDQVFPLQDAPVGEKGEPLGLRVAHHPAARVFFVLRFRWSLADLSATVPTRRYGFPDSSDDRHIFRTRLAGHCRSAACHQRARKCQVEARLLASLPSECALRVLPSNIPPVYAEVSCSQAGKKKHITGILGRTHTPQNPATLGFGCGLYLRRSGSISRNSPSSVTSSTRHKRPSVVGDDRSVLNLDPH